MPLGKKGVKFSFVVFENFDLIFEPVGIVGLIQDLIVGRYRAHTYFDLESERYKVKKKPLVVLFEWHHKHVFC